jgi:CTP-dependent riboflavin kinase
MRGKPIDLHLLHIYLWKRTDSYDTIKVNQRQLAAKMDVAHETLSRNFKKMCDEGRMRRIRSSGHRINTYRVEEPDAWLERQSSSGSS